MRWLSRIRKEIEGERQEILKTRTETKRQLHELHDATQQLLAANEALRQALNQLDEDKDADGDAADEP